jgi:hypothetical protein
MKGGFAYIEGTGVLTWGQNVAAMPLAVIGFRSASIRTHAIIGFVLFVWQIIIGFDVFPFLQV